MKIQSPAFANQGWIPEKYTQEGEDFSPQLLISDVPSEAQSLVLICLDPDAPDPKAPVRVFTHWILYNLPVTIAEIPEGAKLPDLGDGVKEGLNDRGQSGYIGPKPPIGAHRYFFKLYALNCRLNFKEPPTRNQVFNAMDGNIVAMAEVMGRYQLKNK